VDPDLQSAQFLLLMEWMAAAGYEHYEISNFAKPGWRSKHNSAYWQGKTYLGLGPSAHSFNGSERQWNVSNNNLYVAAIQKGELPAEKEILSPVQQLNEYIMTALRTMEGIQQSILKEKHAIDIPAFRKKAEGYIRTGHIIEQNGSFILTNEGKLLADGIAASLFV
jgi:oxygen-independent coproporphyrinogen III oxidase